MNLKKMFVLIMVSSCHRATLPDTEGSTTLGQSAQVYKDNFEKMNGFYTIGDPLSIHKLANFTPLQRAMITVSADRAATIQLTDWEPTKIPYVTVPRDKLKLTSEIQKYDLRPSGDYSYENLADFFSKNQRDVGCDMIIPYHPDTQTKPPLVQNYFSGNAKNYFEVDAFNSMSRSLFVINSDSENNKLPLLYSIKLGTDTIKSVAKQYQKQDNKLLGLQEHVARVNRFGIDTSILKLARQEDILLLNDTVGLNFSEPTAAVDDDSKNNGLIIRSYDAVIDDSDRIYIPLSLYNEVKLDFGTANSARKMYLIELHTGPFGPVNLRLSQEDLKRMNQHLAVQYGKLMAIYYLNGFTSRDLHGQNLLIGVPLNPNIQPRLAVRDLSDHAQFPFLVSNRMSEMLLPFPTHNWGEFFADINGRAYNYKLFDNPEEFVIRGFRLVESQLIAAVKRTQPEIFPKAIDTKGLYLSLLNPPPAVQDFIRQIRHFNPPAPAVTARYHSQPSRSALIRRVYCAPPHAIKCPILGALNSMGGQRAGFPKHNRISQLSFS